MAEAHSLWQRSPPWRWLFSGTVLMTALWIMAAPWRLPLASLGAGRYSPPPAQPAATAAVASQVRQSPRDAELDRPVTVGPTTYGSDTELHVIGVYGAATSGANRIKWLEVCTPHDNPSPYIMDCKEQFEAAHPEYRTITVEVERSNAPMVLVLMAYEAVNWKIALRPGTDLRKVIAVGYSGPDVQGVPDTVPVEVYSHGASPCQNCSRQPGGQWAYDPKSAEYPRAMAWLKSITGLDPSSFQGGYQGDHFTLRRWMGDKPAVAPGSAEEVAGKWYTNVVALGGKTLLLPEGRWQGIALDHTTFARGEDYLLTLARSDNDKLQEVMVAHLQTVSDHGGFPAYAACAQAADYGGQLTGNQAYGAQQCYWVNHSETPWQQPVYRLAANRLADKGVRVPESALVSGFHKADQNMSLTMQYYAFADPAVAGGGSNWAVHPWNPARVQSGSAIRRFIDERLGWASGWYRLMGVMH